MSLANPNRTQVDTIDGTNIVSTGSVTASQVVGVAEDALTPVLLSQSDRRVIEVALAMLAENYFPGDLERDWIQDIWESVRAS